MSGERKPWTGADLAAWRERLGLSWRRGAEALGCTLSTLQSLCEAEDLDRRTELAARFLEEHPEELPPAAPRGRPPAGK